MADRVVRTHPKYSLQRALDVARKIREFGEEGSLSRLLLADALAVKPASTVYRDLLSSSNKYGLTEGNEKSVQISLTPRGSAAVGNDPEARASALREALLAPPVFGRFYTSYDNRRVPAASMLQKILVERYQVPQAFAEECAQALVENGRFAGAVREIGGSPHVMLDGVSAVAEQLEAVQPAAPAPDEGELSEDEAPSPPPVPGGTGDETQQAAGLQHEPDAPRAIFLAHGKKTGPVEKIENLLTELKVPFKRAGTEPNLGRPIPQKVRETMLECNSAILVFTRDEQFVDKEGQPIWRPSENVVYELGAASFRYEDRIVIFKEKGIDFPSNFESIGYIEFEEDTIQMHAYDLLKELVGFGLVRINPS
jgi:hypothetical protein